MQQRIKHLLERNSYLIAVVITVCIAYLSLSKPIVFKPPIEISFLDKILHFIAYMTLTLSWLFALRTYSKKKTLFITLFLFGVLMEFLQGWLTKNRQQDSYDVLANTAGILVGFLLFSVFYKYYLKYFDK